MKTPIKKPIIFLDYKVIAEQSSEWLKEYAKKARVKGFTMGVSGGIDSAVVSTLCAKTGLPLLILEMPIHQGTAEVDRAKDHIAWLKSINPNVDSKEIDLTDTYDIFYEDCAKGESVLGKQITQEVYDFSMANTRSRLRMTTLYQYAGMYGLLVAGTGNKVEDFGIGFYTKYGDGGVDLSPIADLMKSEVYALAAELGVIESILTAAPTDGLHEDGRTDEDQIGATYDELEWAMEWIEEHTVVEQNVGAWYDDTEDRSLESRQRDVIDIYKNFHNSNKHKMHSIPVFDTSKFRN
jgi:NAD+ synthase